MVKTDQPVTDLHSFIQFALSVIMESDQQKKYIHCDTMFNKIKS